MCGVKLLLCVLQIGKLTAETNQIPGVVIGVVNGSWLGVVWFTSPYYCTSPTHGNLDTVPPPSESLLESPKLRIRLTSLTVPGVKDV